jgi:hypothetical protein
MIPINYDHDGKLIEVNKVDHPFMRGVMEFDDYNYRQYNPMVLIPEP